MSAGTDHADHATARSGIAEAALRAARRMGLSRLYLQVVAHEIPDEALVGLTVEDRPGLTVMQAAHVCDRGCDLSPHGCLTALKMQALLGKQRKSPFAVAHLAMQGDALRVHFVPFASPV